MNEDLRELVAMWLATEAPTGERCDELLARLCDDASFRRAFVDEIYMLGVLKAVQAPLPNWPWLKEEPGSGGSS